MSFIANLGLAARANSITDGGEVGTFSVAFTTYDAVFTTNDNGQITVNRTASIANPAPSYENSEEIRDNLSRTIIIELREIVTRNPDIYNSTTNYAVNIVLAFHGTWGGGITLTFRSLSGLFGAGGVNRLADAINDAFDKAFKSDESVVLDRNLTLRVNAHTSSPPGTGGCVGELSEAWGTEAKNRDLLFNPPSGECLVTCLLYGKRKQDLNKKQLMRWASNTKRVHAQQANDGNLDTRVDTFGNFFADMKTYAFTHRIDTDFQDPEVTVPIFLGLGYKFHVLIHPDLKDWQNNEPKKYGNPADTELHIGLVDGHFMVVRQPDIFFGITGPTYYSKKRKARLPAAPKEYSIIKAQPKAPSNEQGIQGNLLTSHDNVKTCPACSRPVKECPSESLQGRKECKRCGCYPKKGRCSEIHEEECDKPYACKKCKCEFDNVDDLGIHACEDWECKHCASHGDGKGHQCTLPQKDVVPPPLGLLAYDYETAQRPDGIHVAVCVCASWITFSDDFIAKLREGAEEGDWREEQFEVQRDSYVGEDCTERFCNDLFVKRRWLGHTVAAHNGAKFDAHFLLDHIIRNNIGDSFSTITDGSAIKCISSKEKPKNHRDAEGNKQLGQPKEVCVVDSYSMVPLSLRKACDAFGVETPKTFFSFDRLNKWYNDGMDLSETQTNPTEEEYPSKDRGSDELRAHIASRDGRPFEFTKELTEYCQIDCDALLEVMRKFHDLFSLQSYHLGGQWLSPWSFMTGAAAAYDSWRMLTYDRTNLPLACSPNAIKTYAGDKQSVAVQWLSIEAQHGGHIEGVLDGTKAKVPGTKLYCDGRRGNTFYDMRYCGGRYKCDKCSDLGVSEATYDENGLTKQRATETFNQKKGFIEGKGFEYVVERQCEFERSVRTDAQKSMQRDVGVEAYKNAIPLDTRSAYSGGRVEPGALYYDAKEDEILRSFDAVSLYPSVMTANYDYPIGLPTKLRALNDANAQRDFKECVVNQNIDKYFGLIRCKVAVKRDRHHHPLVVRHNVGTSKEKLTSSACAVCGAKGALDKCSHDEQLRCPECERLEVDCCRHVRCCSECQTVHLSAECPHGEEDRAFWITCTTEEIKCALAEGDTLLDITEIHHFERRGNPMAPFVRHWYRVKQAASKLPKEVRDAANPAERARELSKYIARIDADSARVFGAPFELKEEELVYNEGLRQCAKIVLNSFYGKFGTNPDKKEQAYVTTADKLAELVNKHNATLALDFIVTGAEKPISVMSHSSLSASKSISATTSVYVAIFVCAYGRLKLYNEALKPAGDKALYWDTDSCLRIMKRSDPIPRCNGFLGDWEHEPEKDSVEFASLGPKTYALALEKGGSMSKCKGVNKAAASKTMNVDKFKRVLLDSVACISTQQEMWSRTHDLVDGDRGFKVRTTNNFARTTRFTASKRMPCVPEVDEEGKVVAIMTKPFGYKST